MSKVVVQKYGGSSVSNTDKIKLIASKLVERKKKNPKIVVVVSAMGDTTDDFINMAKERIRCSHVYWRDDISILIIHEFKLHGM